jgi:hypothetical protein
MANVWLKHNNRTAKGCIYRERIWRNNHEVFVWISNNKGGYSPSKINVRREQHSKSWFTHKLISENTFLYI